VRVSSSYEHDGDDDCMPVRRIGLRERREIEQREDRQELHSSKQQPGKWQGDNK